MSGVSLRTNTGLLCDVLHLFVVTMCASVAISEKLQNSKKKHMDSYFWLASVTKVLILCLQNLFLYYTKALTNYQHTVQSKSKSRINIS